MTTIKERLAELAALELGWLNDGEGEKIRPEALAYAETVLLGLEERGAPRGGIYPRPDGNVQVEWVSRQLGGWAADLMFISAAEPQNAEATSVKTREDRECSSTDLDVLAAWLLGLQKGTVK